MDSIESPLSKLERATEQCQTLRKELGTLCNSESYSITNEFEPNTGYTLYRFVKVPPMPEAMSLRIGEMLYNFRCSLDHLVRQLVLSEGNQPTVRNEFPIFEDVSKYNSEKRSKLKGVSNTVVPIIDSLQPCSPTGRKYLWYLHILCNADKHRDLLLTRRILGQTLHLPRTVSQPVEGNYFAVAVENGAVFLRIKPDVNMDVQLPVKIFFSNTPKDIRRDMMVDNMLGFIKNSVHYVFGQLRSHVK